MTAGAKLRGAFYLGGAVATGAGLHTVISGARSIIGEEQANPALESELRFYSAFYVAYGLAVLRVAPRADSDRDAVRALAGALLLAGAARAGAWRAAGPPNPLQRLLLAVELLAPPIVVTAQARAGR